MQFGEAIRTVVFANCAVSFLVAFVLQCVKIVRVRSISQNGGGVGSDSSLHANISRFVEGEIFPTLRRRWGLAIAWAFCSFVLLVVFEIAVSG